MLGHLVFARDYVFGPRSRRPTPDHTPDELAAFARRLAERDRLPGAVARPRAWWEEVRAGAAGRCRTRRQACPASPDRRCRLTPIFAIARSHLPSRSSPNTSSSSAGQCSQPFAWISASSCPGPQPA